MNNNFQKTFILVLIVSILVISLMTVFAAAEAGNNAPRGISAKSAALYCPETKSFLYEKNADVRLPMASTTKIMTALLALERGDLSSTVTVPKEAVGVEGSSLYLEEGDELTLSDLLYSVLLRSANDASVAVAIAVSGDAESFTVLMNERASELGLTDTHFDNPHGLDSETHYTTARDLALLSAKALENESFKAISSTYNYSFTKSSGEEISLVNHNKLLKMLDGTVGLKTGFTKKSGRCLASAIEKDGVTLVAVTLNAPDDWRDHKTLYEYGLRVTDDKLFR